MLLTIWLEAFSADSDTDLWIQHDLAAHRRLKKTPEYDG